MSLTDSFTAYLRACAAKDLDAVAAMLTDDVQLQSRVPPPHGGQEEGGLTLLLHHQQAR